MEIYIFSYKSAVKYQGVFSNGIDLKIYNIAPRF